MGGMIAADVTADTMTENAVIGAAVVCGNSLASIARGGDSHSGNARSVPNRCRHGLRRAVTGSTATVKSSISSHRARANSWLPVHCSSSSTFSSLRSSAISFFDSLCCSEKCATKGATRPPNRRSSRPLLSCDMYCSRASSGV